MCGLVAADRGASAGWALRPVAAVEMIVWIGASGTCRAGLGPEGLIFWVLMRCGGFERCRPCC